MNNYNNTNELATIKYIGEKESCSSKEEFEWRIQEIAKCKRDIIYFAEKYFKIINLDRGLITIDLYNKQKDLLQFFVNQKRCICLASRQSSKTTTYTIYLLWLTMFFPEKKVMILANKFETALEICSRIRLAYEYIPKFLKPAVITWNKSEILFANRSQLKVFATASDAARGFSANVVVADEFAFVDNNIASKVFESIYPVISSSKNSQFIIVSTPNGADSKNLYYQLWCKANNKDKTSNADGWKAFRFDWYDVPGRDQQWKLNTIAAIGEQRFAQEFGNEFLSSATSKKLIPDDILEKHRIKLSELKTMDATFIKGKQQKILNENIDKMYTFQMWHEFDAAKTYLASGDCSEGIGGDESVLYIWDITNLSDIKMCAKFSSNTVSIIEFAFITSKILSLYNNPYYICERNGVGSGYLDALSLTYGYQNIVKEGKDSLHGVYSHVSIKSKACLWAREMLTTDGFGFTFYDKDLLDEFQAFVKKDTRGIFTIYQALSPAHDDHVMAFIWLCYILQPEIVEKYFICCDTFKSTLDKIYPKILQPLKPYSDKDVKNIHNDPLYKEFLDFKQDINNKLSSIMNNKNEQDDYMLYLQQTRKYIDPYFQDYDSSELSWHGNNKNMLNQNFKTPKFYII